MKIEYIVILLVGVVCFFLGRNSKECEQEEVSRTVDTVEVEIPVIKDSITLLPVYYPVEENINEDSLFQVAKEYWKSIYEEQAKPDDPEPSGNYVAELDLTEPDSSIYGSIFFHSRLPLDPQGYFKKDFTLRQSTITERITTRTKPSFWTNRFIWYVGFGPAYEPVNRQFTLSFHTGVGIRIL